MMDRIEMPAREARLRGKALRKLLGATIILMMIYALYVLVMTVLVPRIIYPFSDAIWRDPNYAIRHVLADDGLQLPVGVHDAGQETRTVLVFVGNAGSRQAFSDLWRPIQNVGSTVLVAPWRGAEGLPGPKNEEIFKQDARAVFDAIPDLLGRDPGPVSILAYSLGTGLALDLAARGEVEKVFLVAPFAKLCEIMSARSWAPACLLPWVDHWDSMALAQDITGEVTILHGEADQLIPLSQGARLADALRLSGKLQAFTPLPGAGHNDILWQAGSAQALRDWVRSDGMER